jgi:hypothetical protein
MGLRPPATFALFAPLAVKVLTAKSAKNAKRARGGPPGSGGLNIGISPSRGTRKCSERVDNDFGGGGGGRSGSDLGAIQGNHRLLCSFRVPGT